MVRERPVAIFDLDGTLYKTECVSLPAVRNAVRDFALEGRDDGLIMSLFGYTTPELCRRLYPGIGDELQDLLSARVRRYERSLIATHGRLYDGVRELLESLKRDGWSLILCTNGSAVYTENVLNGLRLGDFFDGLYMREENRSKADHVATIRKEANGLAVMIGDKKGDIEAARLNGIPSVGVLWGYGPDELGGATFTVRDTQELAAVLSRCVVHHGLMLGLQARGIRPGRRAVIGINGVDTSGKTMFSLEFSSFLTACGYRTACVHIDDFHNEARVRRSGTDKVTAYLDNAFNLGLLKREILLPFRETGRFGVTLDLLDLDTDLFTKRIEFRGDSGTLLIVEGTLLFREPIDPFFDFRIFLHITFEEVLRRAALRDVPKFGETILDGYREKYIPAQRLYLERSDPAARADAVVDNSDFSRPVLLNGECARNPQGMDPTDEKIIS